MKLITIILFCSLFYRCENSPIQSSADTIDKQLTYVSASVQTYSAAITWTCNVEAKGYLFYGLENPNTALSYGVESKIHVVNLDNLTHETNYKYYVTCGDVGNLKGTSPPLTFTTLPIESFTVPTITIPAVTSPTNPTSTLENTSTLGVPEFIAPTLSIPISPVSDLGNTTTLSVPEFISPTFSIPISPVSNLGNTTTLGVPEFTTPAFTIPINPISDLATTATLGLPEFPIPIPGVIDTGLGTLGTVNLMSKNLAERGIWILGGMSSGSIVGQVDLFDPVANIWYASVTTIPTPRTNAGIVSNNGKIYVIGGLIGDVAQSLVEEYDPYLNSWRTMASMPFSLQGFIVASVGNDIYAIGGSLTAYMDSGTLPPFQLYRFTPGIGSNGTWAIIVSSTALFARSDMAGCSIDGLIFMFGGRYFDIGTAFATGDAYVVAANTTTTLGETDLTQARHGMATACYRPIPSDPFPSDMKALIAVGGSTSSDISQPVGAIAPSNVFNYYQPLTNGMYASPVFPISIYGAAAEISYVNRKLYVFGGSTVINTSTKKVYSIDLANPPIPSSWQPEIQDMPITRVGHTAVILNR